MKVVQIQDFLAFQCPACKCRHAIYLARYEWNQDRSHPTIKPEIYLKQTEFVELTCAVEHYVCHSKIENGIIAFFEDSTHELRGQQVELDDY